MEFTDPRVEMVVPILNELLHGYDYTIFGSAGYKDKVGDLDIAINHKSSQKFLNLVHQEMIDADKFYQNQIDLVVPANCEYETRLVSRHNYYTGPFTYADGETLDWIQVNIQLNDNLPWLCGFSTILPTPGIPKSTHAVLLQRAITKAVNPDWAFRKNGLYQIQVKNGKAYNVELVTDRIEDVPNAWGINMDPKLINCFGTLLESLVSHGDTQLIMDVAEHYDNNHHREVFKDMKHHQDNMDKIAEMIAKCALTGEYKSPVSFS